MNKARRKRLSEAKDLIESALSIIAECTEEEQEALDNMLESLYTSERYAAAEDAISSMEDAQYNLQEVMENIEGIIDG